VGLIQREFSEQLLHFARAHKFFDFMREGMAAGEILPCLRKNEIHFYEGGARLFSFSPQSVSTHRRYVDKEGSGYRALRESEENLSTFERIRKTAREHRSENTSSELAAVHRLFKACAVTASDYKHGQLALVDVEARFGKDDTENLRTKMIDLVFIMPDGRVLFIEAKCLGNQDLASSGMAKVEAQVKDYEGHISHACVLDAINRSIQAQFQLIGSPVELATGIFPRVPVLLLDPSVPKRRIGPKNTWLHNRLKEASDWNIKSERPVVIDGRSDQLMKIREFVEKVTGSGHLEPST